MPKKINAASYRGNFANVTLPPLDAGLAWNTSALNTNGTISVIAMNPAFNSVNVLGNGFVLSGTGGVWGVNYYVLSSTNLALPLSNWMRIATNQFNSSGNFNFTNGLNTNSPQSFYLLQSP